MVSFDEEPGDGVLVVGERRVDRYECSTGSECVRREFFECFVGGRVVEVVQHTDRHHQRAVAERVVDVGWLGGDEASPVTEPLVCRFHIPLARVESHVVDGREMVEDVGGPAPDVENPIALADAQHIGGQGLTERLGPDGSLSEPVDGREATARSGSPS